MEELYSMAYGSEAFTEEAYCELRRIERSLEGLGFTRRLLTKNPSTLRAIGISRFENHPMDLRVSIEISTYKSKLNSTLVVMTCEQKVKLLAHVTDILDSKPQIYWKEGDTLVIEATKKSHKVTYEVWSPRICAR